MTVAIDWSRGFGDTSQPRPQVVFVKGEASRRRLRRFRPKI
jgi:hypothetical protein